MERQTTNKVTTSNDVRRLLGLFTPFFVVAAVLLLIAALVAVGVLPESLSSAQNVGDLLRQTSVFACAAMGLFVVMRQGALDLSVGSVVVLSSVVTAASLTAESDQATVVIEHGAQDAVTLMTDLYPLAWPILALTLGAFCGLTCGLINGVIVGALRLNAFVATFATALLYGAVALPLANNRVVYPPHTWLNDLLVEPAYDASGWFLPVWLWAVGGVAVATLCVVTAPRSKASAILKIACRVITTLVVLGGAVQLWQLGLRQPALFILIAVSVVMVTAISLQRLGHTSSVPRASRIAGSERRVCPTVTSFAAAGLLWGIAGLLSFTIEGGASPHVEPESTAWIIVATMAGGAGLCARRGSIAGVVCGAIALSLVINAVTHPIDTPWATGATVGTALVILLLIDRLTAGRWSADVPESSAPRPE